MTQSNKYIYLFVGRSDSGKSTLAKELHNLYGMKQLLSYTTRQRRGDNDNDHIFVTVEDMPNKEEMCAYTEFDGNYYWATHKQVDENDIYIIDPKGIEFFKKSYKGNKIPIVIEIYVPSDIAMRRMFDRGDSKENVVRRLKNDNDEFNNIKSDILFMNLSKNPHNSAIELKYEIDMYIDKLEEKEEGGKLNNEKQQ